MRSSSDPMIDLIISDVENSNLLNNIEVEPLFTVHKFMTFNLKN